MLNLIDAESRYQRHSTLRFLFRFESVHPLKGLPKRPQQVFTMKPPNQSLCVAQLKPQKLLQSDHSILNASHSFLPSGFPRVTGVV
jgi:hypothetical protein